jgi:hypothetical protein
MAPSYRFIFRKTDTERDDANRQTSGLAALCFMLALVVIGLVLVKHLHAVSAAEDCLLMGRPNCDPVIASVH